MDPSRPIEPTRPRRAVVCGASSGIGRAIAHRLASEGCGLVLVARRTEQLEAVAKEVGRDRCTAVAGDYRDDETIEQLSGVVESRWGGRLDILVNSAGVSVAADLVDTPLGEWRRPFDTMVDGAVKLTRFAAPRMEKGGRVIHVTSVHARRAERLASAYGMAKAAIEQLCRSAALELADRGILVNAIAPGFIDTPMSSASGTNELETPWFRAHYVEGHHLPLRRAGRPEEVAGVAAFLAGPDATYITGQTLTVDGGLTITF